MKSPLTIREFHLDDQETVLSLWSACKLIVPHNDPVRDIQLKLASSPDLFLVGDLEGKLIATCMAGYEGHRGWINYLAVSPAYQKHGFATIMMGHVENLLHRRGCPKINLLIRESNSEVLAFYTSIGYTRDNVICLGKRIESGP